MADGMAMATMRLLCPLTTIGSINYFASLGISRLKIMLHALHSCRGGFTRLGTSCPRMTSPTINILLCLEYKDPPLLTHRYTTDRRVGQKMFRRHLACWDLIYLIPLAPYFDDSMLGTKIFTGTTHLGSW